MSNQHNVEQFVYLGIFVVLLCWLVVIGRWVGWSAFDPQIHEIWRGVEYIVYPVVVGSIVALTVWGVRLLKQ